MQTQNVTPAFYFPTNIIWVDDDPQLPGTFAMGLHDALCFRFFTDPRKALTFINEEYQSPLIPQQFITASDLGLSQKTLIQLDIHEIHTLLYNANRFNTVSIFIVDFAMPDLNGVELCKLIADPNYKIIMLTGETDHEIAVSAFNKGLIHKFIKKDALHLSSLLLESIHELQREFFIQQTQPIIKALEKNHLSFPLTDLVFVSFFNELCQSRNIVEYYLLDDEGSFLLIDQGGRKTYLAVCSEVGLQQYVELATADDAPEALIQSIQKHKKIPCFFGNEAVAAEPALWTDYLYPAQTIRGKHTYYYSIIESSAAHTTLFDKKAITYQSFLESRH